MSSFQFHSPSPFLFSPTLYPKIAISRCERHLIRVFLAFPRCVFAYLRNAHAFVRIPANDVKYTHRRKMQFPRRPRRFFPSFSPQKRASFHLRPVRGRWIAGDLPSLLPISSSSIRARRINVHVWALKTGCTRQQCTLARVIFLCICTILSIFANIAVCICSLFFSCLFLYFLL